MFPLSISVSTFVPLYLVLRCQFSFITLLSCLHRFFYFAPRISVYVFPLQNCSPFCFCSWFVLSVHLFSLSLLVFTAPSASVHHHHPLLLRLKTFPVSMFSCTSLPATHSLLLSTLTPALLHRLPPLSFSLLLSSVLLFPLHFPSQLSPSLFTVSLLFLCSLLLSSAFLFHHLTSSAFSFTSPHSSLLPFFNVIALLPYSFSLSSAVLSATSRPLASPSLLFTALSSSFTLLFPLQLPSLLPPALLPRISFLILFPSLSLSFPSLSALLLLLQSSSQLSSSLRHPLVSPSAPLNTLSFPPSQSLLIFPYPLSLSSALLSVTLRPLVSRSLPLRLSPSLFHHSVFIFSFFPHASFLSFLASPTCPEVGVLHYYLKRPSVPPSPFPAVL